MRFIDEAKIHVAAGHGGAGCVAFRREKYVPRGGPAGGDGGRGGHVFFRSSNNLSTLQDFRYRRIYKAENGSAGMGSQCTGSDGKDLEIRVPVGTMIKNAESGEVLFDFEEDDQLWMICKGGRGGKGNAHFATSRFQAPKFAQSGEPGDHVDILLEMKLIADIGIIGVPNAGKSTLISRISAARPKIADYAFTTRVPNLGVVQLDQHQSIVVADVPGLIRNAHKGYGLGHQFLRHIERTSSLLHVLNGEILLKKAGHPTAPDRHRRGIDLLVEDYEMIRAELTLYDPQLGEHPEMIVINKIDLFPEDERLDVIQRVQEVFRSRYQKVPFFISAVSGFGMDLLLAELKERYIQPITVQPGLSVEDLTPPPTLEEIQSWNPAGNK